MDVNCPNCGEPWEMDSLHDRAQELYEIPYYATDEDRRAHIKNPEYDDDAYQTIYKKVRADFQTRGCPALGGSCSANRDVEKAMVASAMYDLLGDDLDGAAAMLEDYDMGY